MARRRKKRLGRETSCDGGAPSLDDDRGGENGRTHEIIEVGKEEGGGVDNEEVRNARCHFVGWLVGWLERGGRKERWKEGRKAGRKEGRKAGRKEGRKERRKIGGWLREDEREVSGVVVHDRIQRIQGGSANARGRSGLAPICSRRHEKERSRALAAFRDFFVRQRNHGKAKGRKETTRR